MTIRWNTALLAVGAFAGLAWGAMPILPATYSVSEDTQLAMHGTTGGRSESGSRRLRAGGTITLSPDRTLRFAEGDRGLFTSADATWSPAGKSALRFAVTAEGRSELESSIEYLFSTYGLEGTARGRCAKGRLAFADGARRLRGSQVSTFTVKGRFRGRPFTIWATARATWRGTRSGG